MLSLQVFVEFNDAADAALPYEESKLWRMMDCYAHTICVHINIPKMDKGQLLLLYIHFCYDEVAPFNLIHLDTLNSVWKFNFFIKDLKVGFYIRIFLDIF